MRADAGPVEPNGARWLLAAGTGWFYRVAGRGAGLSTDAGRQQRRHEQRVLPEVPRVVTAGSAPGRPVRVLLLGNGPAESPGVSSVATSFPASLAQSLAARSGRRVEVKTLVGAGWDLPALAELLRVEQLHWQDALVVTAAYRPGLAAVPLRQWAAYVEALRSTLVEAAGPEPLIRVLSLPWREAARDAPLHWGGLFGNRVRVVAEIAEATLTPDQQALPLRLLGPVMTKEWAGPSFSSQTYLRWANQVAGELCTAWHLSLDR